MIRAFAAWLASLGTLNHSRFDPMRQPVPDRDTRAERKRVKRREQLRAEVGKVVGGE